MHRLDRGRDTAAPAGWCDQMARMWPGTGIVDAMAKQLNATFTHASANPGTKAGVIHV
jgi:hypothetical protein